MREEDLEIALKVQILNFLYALTLYFRDVVLYILKVVIVGNGAVGKSSMIQRYCRGTFTRDYKKTIGVDFLERQIEYVVQQMYSVL